MQYFAMQKDVFHNEKICGSAAGAAFRIAKTLWRL